MAFLQLAACDLLMYLRIFEFSSLYDRALSEFSIEDHPQFFPQETLLSIHLYYNPIIVKKVGY